MILWILLFILVLAISFVLAVQSMKDYQEIPSQAGEEYGIFLIRKPFQFSSDVLASLHRDCLNLGLIISFERLVKGAKSALVIYGPKKLLVNHQKMLDLLELEDYATNAKDGISAWEVGLRGSKKPTTEDVKNYFKMFPSLSENEQFWWQLVLSPNKETVFPDGNKETLFPDGNKDLPNTTKSFQAQIRAVLLSPDQDKRVNLAKMLQNLVPEKLTKLPKAFSDAQIIDFYQKRSLRRDKNNPLLTSEEVLQLLLL
ncbi:hypothetical protein HYW43_05220 [Candidatus Daviesbacteria bacterium]|nr:hypothetical protein [Candidatus Daviesbacteria bacterium]